MAQRTGRGRRPGTLFPRTTRRGRTGRRRRARSSRRRGSFSDAILRERLSRSWRAPRPSLSRSWRCSRSSLCELFLRTNSAPPPGSRRAVPSMRAARLSGVGRGRRRCGMCGRSMRGCGRGALRQTRSGARLPGGSWPRLASALGALGGWPLPLGPLEAGLCPWSPWRLVSALGALGGWPLPLEPLEACLCPGSPWRLASALGASLLPVS